jgi:hypothetical protein
MAFGINVSSTFSSRGHIQLSGTSLVVPFVTGALEFLICISKSQPAEMIRAIRPIVSSYGAGKSIIPPLVDIEPACCIEK